MGKYKANYSCGHSGEVTLYGKIDERFAILERMKTELCPECSDKLAEDKCIEMEGEYNLPGLTGSEKQIKWARQIRRNIVCDMVKENMSNEEFKSVVRHTTASWWIDNRNMDCDFLAKKSIEEKEN